MKKYISKIFQYTKNELSGIILFIVLRAAKSAIVVVSPLIYARVITQLLESTLKQTIYSFFCLCACYLANVLFGYLINIKENQLSKKINYGIKQQITEKLFSIPPWYLDIDQGKMYSIIQSDSSVVSSTLFVLISALFSVITLCGIGIVVFVVNWKLSLVLLCTYPVNIAVNLFFKKRLKEKATTSIECNDEYISLLKDAIGKATDISILDGVERLNGALSKKNHSVYEALLSQGNVKINYSTIMNAISMINHLLLTAVGILFVYTGVIGFGDFIAFNTYSKNFSSSIDVVVNLNTLLQPGIVSMDRLLLLEEQYSNSIHAEKQKSCIDSAIRSIKFENVCFSTKTKDIVNGVSLEANAGEIVGVFGANASGKTTLANLLLTNLIPTGGQILINEQPNTGFKYKSIVRNISYVGTGNSLFPISIRDNLLISCDEVSPSDFEISEICERLNIMNDIECLPQQLDTVVTADGKLSSGQVQKIQFARALLGNSSVLILDESFSNLDVKTKEQIKEYLQFLKQRGKIILIISHVPEDYSICDKKYTLQNGQVYML